MKPNKPKENSEKRLELPIKQPNKISSAPDPIEPINQSGGGMSFRKTPPWDQPDSDAKYEYWSKMDIWSVHEGITLLLEKDPRVVTRESINSEYNLYFSDKPQFQEEYKAINAIAQSSIKAGNKYLKAEVPPCIFIQWVDSKEIPAPETMRNSISKILKLSEQENLKETNNTTSIQDKRETILQSWLIKNEKKSEQPIQLTQEEVWGELATIDRSIFYPVSKETKKDFFKMQKLCSFKRGRRN